MSKYYKDKDIFQMINKIFQNAPEEVIEVIKSVDLVIEINKLPTTEVSEDCISREDTIKIIEIIKTEVSDSKKLQPMPITICNWFLAYIKTAPSVVPSRAEGEWVGTEYERGRQDAWDIAQKVFNSTVTLYEAEDVARQITKTEPSVVPSRV